MTDDGYSILDERSELFEEEPEAETTESAPAALIEVRQLPIIAERLAQVKEAVELTVSEAAALVCTEETVQTVKARRAELRKQFESLEGQRKAVKAEILAPYEEFERVYKDCISGPFKAADAALKAEIDGFEGELKARCREDLERYFDELCQVHGVDFLTLDKALALGGLKINLADAKSRDARKLKDALGMVISNVACGMDNIRKMNDAAEVLAEYKECLDVGQAAARVAQRKRRIAEEKEAEAAREATRAEEAARVREVERFAPPKAQEPPRREPEEVFPEFTFTVYNCTRSQLIRVRDYLKQEGIVYE